ncbi:MAG TPA: hypothetical protein VMW87_09430 [Spirochaetia bacterium]|nr:hypothetical protein [Spirochaetia bacterium]
MTVRIRFCVTTLVSVLFLSISASFLSAQEYSKKQELAVFRLGYYSWQIPTAALGAIDDSIRGVFVNLGRFTVIGYAKSLEARDVDDFIDALRKYKEANAELPKEVQLGREAFTQADLTKLTSSFIVVIPSVSFYNLSLSNRGEFTANLETSFSFVNVKDLTTIGQFTIETSGSSLYAREAVKSAIDGIPLQLSYKVRSMPVFQIKTGILELTGGDAIIEFGRNMGVKPGDEFAVVTPTIIAGHQVDETSGMLVVKDVRESFSIAHPLYTDRPMYVGDQLKEIPRFGVELDFYSDLIFAQSNYVGAPSVGYYPLFGIRATVSRGVYRARPTFEMELPLHQALSGGVPANLYVGLETFNLYMGRFQIAPVVLAGLGGNYFENDFYLSHVGGKAQLNLSLLVTRDLKLSIEAGYIAMVGLRDNPRPWDASYWGPFGGVGFTAKF